MTSSTVHLVFLVILFVLVYCDGWPTLHHRRVENLSLEARTRIREVVEENWDTLIDCTKDLIDARLEDGEIHIIKLILMQKSFLPRDACIFIYNLTCDQCRFKAYSQNAAGSLNFSSRTEDCEQIIFDAVKDTMAKLPSADNGDFMILRL